jgi:hypothetical protein
MTSDASAGLHGRQEAVAEGQFPRYEADRKPVSSANVPARLLVGPDGLEPTTYGLKNCRYPFRMLAIRRFVRGSLTLADTGEQLFPFLCAINVPLDR